MDPLHAPTPRKFAAAAPCHFSRVDLSRCSRSLFDAAAPEEAGWSRADTRKKVQEELLSIASDANSGEDCSDASTVA
jgi:hypothetical protein